MKTKQQQQQQRKKLRENTKTNEYASITCVKIWK